MASILTDPATLPARVYMALLFLPVRLTNIPQLTRLAGSVGSQTLVLPDLSAGTALGLAVFATLLALALRGFWNLPIGHGMVQQQFLAEHAAILAALALLALPACVAATAATAPAAPTGAQRPAWHTASGAKPPELVPDTGRGPVRQRPLTAVKGVLPATALTGNRGDRDAFKVHCRSSAGSDDTYWLSPKVHPFIKRVEQRSAGHPAGPGTQESELIARS